MTGKYPRPSDSLPAWARAYFDRYRAHFDEMEMVPTAPDGTKLWLAYHFPGNLEPGETLTPTHRHEAFYRLFCADNNNDDMRRMWKRADEVIVIDIAARPLPEDGRWFLTALINGTDATIPDEKLRRLPPVRKPPYQPLKNPEQRAVRKVVNLLRCLAHVTPPDCFAYPKRHFGSTTEWLQNKYELSLGLPDRNDVENKYDLSYTRDSKRGWIQHRRAHDRIRNEVIAAIHRLAAMTCDPDNRLIAELRQIADDLATWPDMKTEHGHQIELLSREASWADWFRYAYDQWLEAIEWGEALGHLDKPNWVTLTKTLFPGNSSDKETLKREIYKIIDEVEASRPERKRAYREKVLAEEAAFHASQTRR